jgi:hypothetical protein
MLFAQVSACTNYSITSSVVASSCVGLKAERLRGLEVDDELELGRLFDRDVGRFCSTQDHINKFGGTAELPPRSSRHTPPLFATQVRPRGPLRAPNAAQISQRVAGSALSSQP